MSTKAPYFSIGIPTRNRAELAEQAVRYVLEQSFKDFELIIADSDETDNTLNCIKKFQDTRIRYYNTRGKTGPENFQFCAEQAKGEYFLMLTDRLLLRPHALEILYQNSEAHRYPSMRYQYDTFDDRRSVPKVWTPDHGDGKNNLLTPDEVLTLFVEGTDPERLNRVVPTPQYSAIHRSLLEKIRGTQARPYFAPIVPDMWCIFAQLSCCEGQLLNIRQSLSVFIIRDGVFYSMLLKKKSSLTFIKEISKGDEMEMTHVPLKFHMIDNMIYNDYLRAQKVYGGRLLNYPLPWSTYFIGLYYNMQGSMKFGVNMRPEYREWKRALALQPKNVQREVHRRIGPDKTFAKLETNRLIKKMRSGLGLKYIENRLRSMRRPARKQTSLPYQTAAEYMAFSEAQKSLKARK